MNISNKDFMKAIFGALAPSEYCWTTVFTCSPEHAKNREWAGDRAYPDSVEDTPYANSYFSVAALSAPNKAPAKRNQRCFSRLACVVLDDIHSIDLAPTWRIETSEGNYQIGFKLNPPITDPDAATDLHKRLTKAGAIVGSDTNGNNPIRYVRLPVGMNNKYETPFKTRLDIWNPDNSVKADDLLVALGVDPIATISNTPQKTNDHYESDAALISNIISGESYHDAIRTLTARYNSRGMDERSIVTTVEGFMGQSNDGSDRWLNRFGDILRATRGAIEKYTPVPLSEAELMPEYQYSTTTPKPVEYVLDGFIANKLTLIAGAPGVGKSTALVSLSAIVAGLMDAHDITSELKRKVFYVTEDTDQVERILYGMRAQRLIDVSEDKVAERFRIIHAYRRSAQQVGQMIGLARSIGRGQHESGYAIEPLVVLDTANATLDLDNENDNSEAGKAIAIIKQSMGNAAIWIVGHTSKAVKRADLANLSFRGASAFEGDTNATSYLFKEEKNGGSTTFLALGKHRYVSDFQEVQINAISGAVTIPTPWGTNQICRYRVGVPSRSSAKQREEAKKEQTAEAISQSQERVKRQIVYTVLNANKDGEPINRETLKRRIAAKSVTVVGLINALIDDGFIKEVKSQGKRGSYLQVLKDFVDAGTIGNESAEKLLSNHQI